MEALVPKPPPTAGATTRSLCAGRSSISQSVRWSQCGTWVEAQTVSPPPRTAGSARIPRGSIGIPAYRGTRMRARTRSGASARARSGSPIRTWKATPTLSPHSSWRIGGARRHGGLHVGNRRKRLVVHVDELERVLRGVWIAGEDHRHRLPDVAHPVVDQRELGRGLQAEPHAGLERRGWRAGERERPEQRAEVRVREAADHGGVGARAIQPDPADPRVGVWAPEDRRVETAGRPEVVDVAPSPRQELGILAALDLGPDVLRPHVRPTARQDPRAPSRSSRDRGTGWHGGRPSGLRPRSPACRR